MTRSGLLSSSRCAIGRPRHSSTRTIVAVWFVRSSSQRPARRSRLDAERLWASDTRRATLVIGLEVPKDVLERRIEERSRCDVRAWSRRRGACCARGRRGFERRREGARAAGDRRSFRQRRRARRSYAGRLHYAVLPAKVDAPDPRRRHDRRKSTPRAGGGCNPRSGTRSVTPTSSSSATSRVGSTQPACGKLSARPRRRLEVLLGRRGHPGGRDLERRRLAGGAVRERTRIAAAWLAERTGARMIRVRVGSRDVLAHILETGAIEQDLGEVEVGEREQVEGIDLVPVLVGIPTLSSRAIRRTSSASARSSRRTQRFPQRTNVQVVRASTVSAR